MQRKMKLSMSAGRPPTFPSWSREAWRYKTFVRSFCRPFFTRFDFRFASQISRPTSCETNWKRATWTARACGHNWYPGWRLLSKRNQRRRSARSTILPLMTTRRIVNKKTLDIWTLLPRPKFLCILRGLQKEANSTVHLSVYPFSSIIDSRMPRYGNVLICYWFEEGINVISFFVKRNILSKFPCFRNCSTRCWCAISACWFIKLFRAKVAEKKNEKKRKTRIPTEKGVPNYAMHPYN